VNRPLRLTPPAKNQHRNFFDYKQRSLQRRILTSHFVRRKQGFLHYAGQETQAKMYRLDLNTAAAF
jgi:type I restriction-modification system DNA methylase subunit